MMFRRPSFSWYRTAAAPMALASVCRMNGSSGSGRCRKSGCAAADLIASNASPACLFHQKMVPVVSRSVSGAIVPDASGM